MSESVVNHEEMKQEEVRMEEPAEQTETTAQEAAESPRQEVMAESQAGQVMMATAGEEIQVGETAPLMVQGKCLALIDLKGHVIQIVQETSTGNVYMYEKWSQNEDVIEVELGNLSEEQVIEEIVKRIDEEFKLPKSVRGALKAKIKQVKLPVTIRLIQEDRANIVDIKGSKGKFQLAIKYYIQ